LALLSFTALCPVNVGEHWGSSLSLEACLREAPQFDINTDPDPSDAIWSLEYSQGFLNGLLMDTYV
jgi:hypothetical protein